MSEFNPFEHPLSPISFSSLPPELQTMVRRKVEASDRGLMQSEIDNHALYAAFDGASYEVLRLYFIQLRHIASISKGPGAKVAAFQAGLALGMMHARHDTCLVHEIRHGIDDLPEMSKPVVDADDDDGVPHPDEAQLLLDYKEAEARHEQYTRYAVEPNPNSGVPGELPFRCARCHFPIHSLEDRMLRSPGVEGCPGCLDKSAHG
jgi:hypothetical protein